MLDQIQSQFRYMQKMRYLLANNLQKDHFARVDTFYPSTGLSSSFIYGWIRNTYFEATRTLEYPGEKFSSLTSRLIIQLDGRILKLATYLRLNGLPVDSSSLVKTSLVADAWLSRIRGNEPHAEALLYASMDVNDILFACQAIVEEIPEKAQPFIEQELSPFIENILPKYLEILPPDNLALKESLKSNFNNMQNALSQNDIEAAKNSLVALKNAISS